MGLGFLGGLRDSSGSICFSCTGKTLMMSLNVPSRSKISLDYLKCPFIKLNEQPNFPYIVVASEPYFCWLLFTYNSKFLSFFFNTSEKVLSSINLHSVKKVEKKEVSTLFFDRSPNWVRIFLRRISMPADIFICI